ncbi:hypothetical protein [Oricola thermophila]|uniref:DUF1345 domain-containing protein n=1 Tax=Oricola thermophila TaxID=2742145 RepID=A0A6N1VFS7_9HYPH|nr:hypothetical protein [Oricola thermophila]QKV18072.1 hypothetical protein HTY61_06170 [Oricola thermophila]
MLVFFTGVAVAMAMFHLVRAQVGFTPGFDRKTLDEIGPVNAFLVYCCTGPVLLTQAFDRTVPPNAVVSLRNTVVFMLLLLLWTFSLGVVIVESARALL